MDRDDKNNIFRYVTVVLVVIVLVIMYVWQNIEVMRLKMDFRETRSSEIELIKKNDRLRYEICKMNNLDNIREYADRYGLKPLDANDVTVLKVEKKSETKQ